MKDKIDKIFMVLKNILFWLTAVSVMVLLFGYARQWTAIRAIGNGVISNHSDIHQSVTSEATRLKAVEHILDEIVDAVNLNTASRVGQKAAPFNMIYLPDDSCMECHGG
jgi:hypothetical protein